jgi:hypothetical protein
LESVVRELEIMSEAPESPEELQPAPEEAIRIRTRLAKEVLAETSSPATALLLPQGDLGSAGDTRERNGCVDPSLLANGLLAPAAPDHPLSLVCRLPSCLPVQVASSEPVGTLKHRLLQHCGIDPVLESGFGLALGFVALNDELSWTSNDVSTGDEVIMYLRGGDAPAAVRAREHAAAGL